VRIAAKATTTKRTVTACLPSLVDKAVQLGDKQTPRFMFSGSSLKPSSFVFSFELYVVLLLRAHARKMLVSARCWCSVWRGVVQGPVMLGLLRKQFLHCIMYDAYVLFLSKAQSIYVAAHPRLTNPIRNHATSLSSFAVPKLFCQLHWHSMLEFWCCLLRMGLGKVSVLLFRVA